MSRTISKPCKVQTSLQHSVDFFIEIIYLNKKLILRGVCINIILLLHDYYTFTVLKLQTFVITVAEPLGVQTQLTWAPSQGCIQSVGQVASVSISLIREEFLSKLIQVVGNIYLLTTVESRYLFYNQLLARVTLSGEATQPGTPCGFLQRQFTTGLFLEQNENNLFLTSGGTQLLI